jgi:hypothetical protein
MSRQLSLRAARARSEEKKRKRDEKTALRKTQRAEAETPTDETTNCARLLVNDGP